MTPQKIIGQKIMERKNRVLILLDVCMLHVIPMGGCSGAVICSVDGRLTHLSTSAQAGPGNDTIPLNYII